jgi:GH35 family endo-1,4-beta-xylanase
MYNTIKQYRTLRSIILIQIFTKIMKKNYKLLLVICLIFSTFLMANGQTNLIANPGFEAGSGNNFTNWSVYNGGSYMTATTVPSEVHGGGRALKSAGPGFPPGNQWQIQLVSDAMATTIGQSYTFKIWVKAATAGGNIRFTTKPSDQYSGDMNVPDGVWTQLSWNFVANVANTQITLDLGHSNVVYYLDDAELSVSALNIVPNPGFELGSGNVFTNWSKYNGSGFLTATTAASEIHGGTRALKSSGPGYPAGEEWKVQLVSDAMATVIGQSYTFTIWVKAATAGGNIRFSTQPQATALYSSNYNVPDGVWTQLSWTFTANAISTQMSLDLGRSNVVYYLDDAEILVDPIITPPVILTNYMPNPSFEDGTGNVFTDWIEINGAGFANETTVPSEVKVGSRALKAISTMSDVNNTWKVQMASKYLSTPVGKNFTYSLYVKSATAGGKIKLSTVSPLLNYATYAYSPVTDVGTDWQKISLDFIPVEPTTRVTIDFGGSANTYFVDDVKMVSADALVIGNGGFETGAGDNFTNWTKLNGETYLTATTTDQRTGSRGLKADVTGTQPNAGNSYSLQISTDEINTVVGEEYTVSVWAKAASTPGIIQFSTRPNPIYSGEFAIPTTWTKIQWNFTANETKTKIDLNVGKVAGIFFLDDVEINVAIVNKASNGSFELGTGDDFTNWSKWSGGANITATTVATEVKEALRAVKIVNPAPANPWDVQLASDPMTLIVGKNYSASIYVRSNVGGEVIRFSTNSTTGALYSPDFTTTTGWTKMTWNFTANDASLRILLDVGKNAGTFFLDDIQVIKIGDCDIKYQIPANQTPIATGKNKFLGSVYSPAQKMNLNKYFNQVTPENAGKWGEVETSDGVYDWTKIDEAREYAKVNGFPFRYHVLVWGSQQPLWLKPMTDAQKVVKIKAWFQAVANHFDGSSNARAKLEYIEVVNEVINDPPNNLDNGPGHSSNIDDPTSGDYVNALKSLNTELGTTPGTYDWVINSFKLARRYFPCETKLMINEYSAENNFANVTNDYEIVINQLKAQKLLDVIGMQGHAFNTKKSIASQSFADHTLFLKSKLDQIASTGLPIMITELDIDGNTDSTYAATNDVAVRNAFQKKEYERIFNLYWKHPSVVGITLWGYLTGHWRTAEEAYLVDVCTGNEKPALRDFLNNTLNNTPNSIRASANPPLATTFLPKICGVPDSTGYSCAGEVPVAVASTVTALSSFCSGTVSITVQDVTTPTILVVNNPYIITRTWTATDACGNVQTGSQKISVGNYVTLPTASGVTIPANSTASLSATCMAGSTPKWYSAMTGGTVLSSANPFVTPVLSTNTNYYVACETTGSPTCESSRVQVMVTVNSPTITSIATGDWFNPATWDLGRIPQAGDIVIIDTPHTVTLTGEGNAKSLEQRGTLKLTVSKVNLGL